MFDCDIINILFQQWHEPVSLKEKQGWKSGKPGTRKITQQPMKVSHCHFSIIDGILQVQLREVIKQFYSSILIFFYQNQF
jgi:hypothetical protein